MANSNPTPTLREYTVTHRWYGGSCLEYTRTYVYYRFSRAPLRATDFLVRRARQIAFSWREVDPIEYGNRSDYEVK